MKTVLMLMIALVLSGCTTFEMGRATTPDGKVIVEVKTTRFLFSRNIEGLYVESPTGWRIGFDKHLSDFELGLKYGALGIQVGGASDEGVARGLK